jgi:hypothetical protein
MCWTYGTTKRWAVSWSPVLEHFLLRIGNLASGCELKKRDQSKHLFAYCRSRSLSREDPTVRRRLCHWQELQEDKKIKGWKSEVESGQVVD